VSLHQCCGAGGPEKPKIAEECNCFFRLIRPEKPKIAEECNCFFRLIRHQKGARSGGAAAALIRIYGSPGPKEIFAAPQHCCAPKSFRSRIHLIRTQAFLGRIRMRISISRSEMKKNYNRKYSAILHLFLDLNDGQWTSNPLEYGTN
jgi:hypothetical protein